MATLIGIAYSPGNEDLGERSRRAVAELLARGAAAGLVLEARLDRVVA